VGFLLIITGCGESGEAILLVSIAFFVGRFRKFFGQRWLSPPRNNWPVRLCLGLSADFRQQTPTVDHECLLSATPGLREVAVLALQ